MNIKFLNKTPIKNYNLMIIFTFLLGVLLIFATYAWFSTALNVKVKFFNMIVSNNNGLYISFDGITFESSVEISQEFLTKKLKETYPNNISQWAELGLTPVSSNGISNSNQSLFNMYASSGYGYKNKKKDITYLSAKKIDESKINSLNHYISFDLFLKNVTGSPMSDNLYLDNGTGIQLEASASEEAMGLVNSIRFGFVKIGSVSSDSDVNIIQNIECNNSCEMKIYEPNSKNHTNLSSFRMQPYGIDLSNGLYYPTFAVINEFDDVDIKRGIFGLNNIDLINFSLQKTETTFNNPLFQIPDGITKIRVYVWIEGQDLDSLETKSKGTDISININLIKDSAGYDYYN